MLSWQRLSLETFLGFYNFKDWRSTWVHALYGCATFALALLFIRAVGVFDDEDHGTRTRRKATRLPLRPTSVQASSIRENWSPPPAFTFETGGTGSAGDLKESTRLHAAVSQAWYRSPWLLCATTANLLPWLVWAPQFNRFALSPSYVCVPIVSRARSSV